jgi:hypothetical protein
MEEIINSLVLYNHKTMESIENQEEEVGPLSPNRRLVVTGSKNSFIENSESVYGKYRSNLDESTRGPSQSLGNPNTDRVPFSEMSQDLYLRQGSKILDLKKVKQRELQRSRNEENTYDLEHSIP